MAMGENIRRWREYRAYGQAELARLVGISPNTLYRIEVEGREPRPATLRRLAEVLAMDVATLRDTHPPHARADPDTDASAGDEQ